MAVTVDVVAVVVVAVAAAVGWSLLHSAAAVGGDASVAVGGRLDSIAAAVVGGRCGGSGLLPSAARDRKLRLGARSWAPVAALNGCLGEAATGLTDDGLQKKNKNQ